MSQSACLYVRMWVCVVGRFVGWVVVVVGVAAGLRARPFDVKDNYLCS